MVRFVVDRLDRSLGGSRIFLIISCVDKKDADALEAKIRDLLQIERVEAKRKRFVLRGEV